MRQSRHLPLVGLLLNFLIPSQLCTICKVSEENQYRLNPLLNTMSNTKNATGSQPASVLLSLRLVGIQNQSLTQELVQQIKNNVERTKGNLSSGNLALIILALGACNTSDETFIVEKHLVGHLEDKFQAEIENMRLHDGNPLTNYYQLSLGVLALCLFNGTYSTTTIAEFFTPENKNFYFGGHFSVDTGAMAVVALTCVKRSLIKKQTKADTENSNVIENYIKSLIEKILPEIKENGLIGNTFSTGAAMQALFVSSNYYNKTEWNCQKTRDTILKEISRGTFKIPISAAQILPALLGKTYLDVNKDAPCVHGSDNFNISIQMSKSLATPPSPSYISVHYSVKINKTYSTNITTPNNSVFLDVMKAAQEKNETLFSFTMEQGSWGPYITSVQGIKANNDDRTYWELLSGGKPLSQGADNYVVHNGENLEVRWSKY